MEAGATLVDPLKLATLLGYLSSTRWTGELLRVTRNSIGWEAAVPTDLGLTSGFDSGGPACHTYAFPTKVALPPAHEGAEHMLIAEYAPAPVAHPTVNRIEVRSARITD
ncbi:MAG: hypothetical protein ACR2G6_05345 [Gemmatimonadaceae bacterium]